MKLRAILAAGLALNMSFAGSPVIGTILAKGSFRLDGSTVMGNGTLFEGSMIETDKTGSSIQLSSGARLSLGAASRGKLYGDHIVLEKGESQLENGTGFRLLAVGLTIQPERGASTARVVLEGNTRVRVAALTGSFRVLNSRGTLVANLAAGTALAFEPQPASANATRITGVLSKQEGRLVLTDEVTKVNIEVTGAGLLAQVGKRVEITGSMDPAATPIAGMSQVVRAKQFQSPQPTGPGPGGPGPGGPGPGGGTAPAGAGGGAGASAGISIGIIAVVAGVAAAAVVGGLAAAGGLPGQGDAPISR